MDDSGSKFGPHASVCHPRGDEPAACPAPSGEGAAPNEPDPDRRCFVGRAGRTLAVAAPLILMFRPSTAYAASASSS